jgi:hypothetical protein
LLEAEPMSRSGLWLGAVLLAGCTADVPFGADIRDDEADSMQQSEVDSVEQLLVADAEPDPGTPPITIENATTIDADQDGIPDATEELLLRRYRPYYKFSLDANGNDERYRPTSPITQIANAQLKTLNAPGDGVSAPLSGCGRAGDFHLDPPESLYTCRTDTSFLVTQSKENYALNIDDALYAGTDMATAEAEATGMYGHVAPTSINGHDAYKIEYWQFYAFNNQDISVLGIGDMGDHEGDWTSVQLWFDKIEHRIVRVRYLIHGKKAEFDVAPGAPSCSDCMITMKGPNYNPNPPEFFSNQAAYTNNAAEFYIDPHHYKHVVVYIEAGAHETWPGAWGHASIDIGIDQIALNPHKGNGTNYLVPDIQDRLLNMGEVEHALTRAGRLILPYDGLWGSTNDNQVGYWGPVRQSPVGPAFHCSWRWPDRAPLSYCSG